MKAMPTSVWPLNPNLPPVVPSNALPAGRRFPSVRSSHGTGTTQARQHASIV